MATQLAPSDVHAETFEALSAGQFSEALESMTIEQLEQLLGMCIAAGFEAYVGEGVVLKIIRDSRKYRESEYPTWKEYCKSGRANGYSDTQANSIIAAASVRPLLPEMTGDSGQNWSVTAIEVLASPKLSVADKKRVAKRIVARVKKGEKLSRRIAKEEVDAELGIERQKKIKAMRVLDKATLEHNMDAVHEELVKWVSILSTVYEAEDWSELEDARPGLIASVVDVLDSFSSFMKG